MDIIKQDTFQLKNLDKINVLLGKNGSGKSTLLKKVEEHQKINGDGEINYVTPERGGTLQYNANIEQNITNDENFVTRSKRQNQWNQFKQYSISQFRKLELLSLREIEQDPDIRKNLEHKFDTIIDRINALLTNVKLVRSANGSFEIYHKVTDKKLTAVQISSGESELISLSIECLTFAKTCQKDKTNLLLLDEPDVHLHPDLQAKFIIFLLELLKDYDFKIIIATHSSAILGALLDYKDATFSILENNSTDVFFIPISEMYQKILPIFGAHPLSNLFNQNPILLVEGEDDVRIFQQAIRTSNGNFKCYPCQVGGNGFLPEYESAVVEIINGVYDNAKAFSLRDRDEEAEEIEDIPPLIRMKTSCRAAENLILTDEVLDNLGTSWIDLKVEIETWLETFTDHKKYEIMNQFKDQTYPRKTFDLKEIRNIIIGLTPSAKPWEVAVGQVIGKISNKNLRKDFDDNKICNFLGRKFVENFI